MRTLLVSTFCLVWFSACLAEDMTVRVSSADGKDLTNIVVYWLPEPSVAHRDSQVVSSKPAIMDQVNKQFRPHILVVQKGMKVRFPNSDSIKHHVFSFSKAKTFELKLYKGLDAVPQDFPDIGIVELGCAVHDWMLGYIAVVDTPYFGKTNKSGVLNKSIPAGKYRVKIWHPRIQDDTTSLEQNITVEASQEIRFQLKKPMLPSLGEYEADDDGISEYD